MTFTLTKTNENPQKIQTPLTFKQWLSIHFAAWGFYKIVQDSPKRYFILNSFTGELEYTITK